MDSISLNHANTLAATTIKSAVPPTSNTPQVTPNKEFTASPASPSTIVTLSPESTKLSFDDKVTPRFESLEELSEHKTRLLATWVTQDELETGTRRPYASPEDERLSRLSMKELMIESSMLPGIDSNGHLQSGFAGTEQGDRIGVAVANIVLESQYNFRKAAKQVEASLEKFEQYLHKEFNIAPDSYDITFIDGKITAISTGKDGADHSMLQKIQRMLDAPEKIKPAKDLVQDIKTYNEATFTIINNQLTQYIYGATQNRYLPKEISADWLVEGVNYSHVTTSGNIKDKWLSIVADAREKYHTALKDGSHLKNSTTAPGILELTKLRQLGNQDFGAVSDNPTQN